MSFGAEGVRTSTASSIGRKNGWNPFPNLIVSGPLAGEALALRGNVAYVRDTLEKDNLLFWGVAVEFPVTERVRGFVETFQITHEKPTQHLGMLVWAIPERLWIDGTVGFQTMSRADGTTLGGASLLFAQETGGVHTISGQHCMMQGGQRGMGDMTAMRAQMAQMMERCKDMMGAMGMPHGSDKSPEVRGKQG